MKPHHYCRGSWPTLMSMTTTMTSTTTMRRSTRVSSQETLRQKTANTWARHVTSHAIHYYNTFSATPSLTGVSARNFTQCASGPARVVPNQRNSANNVSIEQAVHSPISTRHVHKFNTMQCAIVRMDIIGSRCQDLTRKYSALKTWC